MTSTDNQEVTSPEMVDSASELTMKACLRRYARVPLLIIVALTAVCAWPLTRMHLFSRMFGVTPTNQSLNAIVDNDGARLVFAIMAFRDEFGLYPLSKVEIGGAPPSLGGYAWHYLWHPSGPIVIAGLTPDHKLVLDLNPESKDCGWSCRGEDDVDYRRSVSEICADPRDILLNHFESVITLLRARALRRNEPMHARALLGVLVRAGHYAEARQELDRMDATLGPSSWSQWCAKFISTCESDPQGVANLPLFDEDEGVGFDVYR